VQAIAWGEARLTRLSLGHVGLVLGGWQRLQAPAEEAQQALVHCGGYLQAHRGRPPSKSSGEGALREAVGGMESSKKFMCHVRLKRSGAWWYAANSNQMLALRCAKYNGTLDRVCMRYSQRRRETSE
jgi:hypothetical protein